jgi:hypothetical protein
VLLGLEAITLGLDETLTLGLGDELVLCPGEALALRVGEMLAIALFTELPHPATMHPAIRITAESRRPLVNRRMLILPGFYSSRHHPRIGTGRVLRGWSGHRCRCSISWLVGQHG